METPPLLRPHNPSSLAGAAQEVSMLPFAPRRSLALTALVAAISAMGCVASPVDDLAPGDDIDDTSAAYTFISDYEAYFDPPATTTFSQSYGVVGSITPPSWSWGKIELLQGRQKFRTEGYNLRTAKGRWQDTFEDSTYPLRTYFGALNQELVD